MVTAAQRVPGINNKEITYLVAVLTGPIAAAAIFARNLCVNSAAARRYITATADTARAPPLNRYRRFKCDVHNGRFKIFSFTSAYTRKPRHLMSSTRTACLRLD